MLTALLAGIGLCLSLIVAPGAQNVFLLREGIKHSQGGRSHVVILAAVCLASDVILISAGVGGFGVVIEQVPWLFDVARWAGVAFLSGYGLLAAIRVFRGGSAIDAGAAPAAPAPAPAPGGSGTATLVAPAATRTRTALVPAVLTCIAITWLNPHTYLDTVLLLGSISTNYGDARWFFAVGAILGSAIWFAFLTFAARYAARWLRSPRSWRVLDAVIAVMMFALAGVLAFD
ncbi:amino acid transporter [Microbacterium nanhaiense]|uniref:Amino acid transporter n=1 Tax=Microbacterium nanhaiense TaxID=1301026 RepID=A0ABQ2N6A7_9MICO|nr:LysE/ArgO family amino acid transporter [Microbacterium nanhaiense]GGO64563.1 amino acid transporter [Microbacterium nanhaiense]